LKLGAGKVRGICRAIAGVRNQFPKIHFGYFNRSREMIDAIRKVSRA